MIEGSIKKIIIAIVAGLVFFILGSLVFSFKGAILVGLIALLVALWSNNGLPLGVVSLLPIILFPAFDLVGTNAITANYAKSIIFLFLGGFMLAIGVEKTGLHKIIANKVLSIFPNTARGIIFSLAITSALLSAFLSNTTTALLLMPLALFLTDSANLKMRFALAIAYGASIGGIITPIGTPPNLILLGIMDEYNMQTIPFVTWMMLVFPLSATMMVVVGSVLSIGAKKGILELKDESKKMDINQKKVLYLLIGLIAILLVNAPIKPYYNGLGLNEKGILLAFGLSLFMPPFNILVWEDIKKIPFNIMFLFGAGFSIAYAFTKIGLAKEVADYLLAITSLPPILLMAIIATMVTFSTEVTSNTALISIILPIIYAVGENSGINTTLIMMVATICASYAFMLPIATPPNAIAMSSGVVDVKTMVKYGIIFNLAGIVLIVVVANIYWKFFI